MTLGSTQPLTGMSTRNIPGGKGWLACKSDLTAICEPVLKKMWEPRRLTTLWTSRACYRDSFILFFSYLYAVCQLTSSLAPETSGGFHSYSEFKSFSVIGLCSVNVNIPASKTGALKMGLKDKNGDFI
jgi:hypothetical protein